MRNFVVAATGVALLASGIQAAAAEDMLNPSKASVFDYYALFEHYKPGWAKEHVEWMLQGPLCHLKDKAANEFDLRDKLNNVATFIENRAKTVPSAIGPMTAKYELGKYDFEKHGFPIYAQKAGESFFPIGELSDIRNGYCWPSNSLTYSPRLVYYHPSGADEVHFLPMSEDDARSAIGKISDKLYAQMTFSLIFDGKRSYDGDRLAMSGSLVMPSLKLTTFNGQVLKDFGSVRIVDETFVVGISDLKDGPPAAAPNSESSPLPSAPADIESNPGHEADAGEDGQAADIANHANQATVDNAAAELVPGWSFVDTWNGRVASKTKIAGEYVLKISCGQQKSLNYIFEGDQSKVNSVTIPASDDDLVMKPNLMGFLEKKDAARFVKAVNNIMTEAKTYSAHFDQNAFSMPLFINGHQGSPNSVLGDFNKVRETVRGSCKG